MYALFWFPFSAGQCHGKNQQSSNSWWFPTKSKGTLASTTGNPRVIRPWAAFKNTGETQERAFAKKVPSKCETQISLQGIPAQYS